MKTTCLLTSLMCNMLLALTPISAHSSCGSAFCAVNTNWTPQSVWTETGSSVDLRYEYINQDRLMSGARRVSVAAMPDDPQEVSTRNQNLFVSLGHQFASGWGVNLLAPVIDRQHLHRIDTGGSIVPETTDFTELGDVRLSGHYQRAASRDTTQPAIAGISVGLKLPTGRLDVASREGQRAERSLQPGSGTTDLTIGAFYHRKLPQRGAAWFAQMQMSQPLYSRAGFKPGAQWGVDIGYTAHVNARFSALLQANLLLKTRDRGAAAEPADSGGRFLYLSPGLSYAASKTVQLYGFVQLPVYQYVNGVQLTAASALVAGISKRF